MCVVHRDTSWELVSAVKRDSSQVAEHGRGVDSSAPRSCCLLSVNFSRSETGLLTSQIHQVLACGSST